LRWRVIRLCLCHLCSGSVCMWFCLLLVADLPVEESCAYLCFSCNGSIWRSVRCSDLDLFSPARLQGFRDVALCT
ncbi:unnamed protein product, partial [Brassica rapa]